MKTALSAIFLSLIVTIAVAATNKNQFIGHWRYVNESIINDLIFSDNGTFAGTITDDGKITFRFAGTWSLDGETLSYKYTESTLERIPVGTADRDKLIEITDQHFVVEVGNGARQKYSRIQSAVVSDELAKDIQAIIAITPESEKNHVDNYLRNGPEVGGNTFVTAAVAKNTLNILERDERITMPLARTMIRFAQNAEYPKDTRQYAFAKLTRMAERDKEVAALVTPLAKEIAKREQDPLKRYVDHYLKK